MIETSGTITVAEAAKRLKKSIEQVRRDLREGRLKGQRVGNQWFVDEKALDGRSEPLISQELADRIKLTRERIFRRNGVVFDAVAMVRESREAH
jgi:excisionase family DNA binding protein